MQQKNKAHLFGPFFGELSWEYFRFAPYAIHLKKTEPDTQLVVMTRPERFDLYGQYADVLVPLNVKNDNMYEQSAFKLLGFELAFCKKYNELFRDTYRLKYNIVSMNTPDVSTLRYRIKWQFPRSKMDYDFKPRTGNLKATMGITKTNNLIILDTGYEYTSDKYNIFKPENLKRLIRPRYNINKISQIGCLINLIQGSRFVISDLKSDVGKLALLLKTPVIYPNRDMSNDKVSLLNPLNTPIFDCENVKEGVKFYENYI